MPFTSGSDRAARYPTYSAAHPVRPGPATPGPNINHEGWGHGRLVALRDAALGSASAAVSENPRNPIEEGTHATLIQHGGLYHHLYTLRKAELEGNGTL